MSHIPNCRAEGYYNQDNLNNENKAVISGFDFCAENAVNSFFNNTDVYFDDDSYMMHMLYEALPERMINEDGEVKTYLDLLKASIMEWIESQRDELITAMIDEQGEHNE